MPDELNIDLDRLLTPISADRPCGEDLRLDKSSGSLYSKLKDYRNGAKNIERQGRGTQPSVSPDTYFKQALSDWKNVASSASEILAQHSKDLQVAVWYTEVLTRLQAFEETPQGFKGLSHGLQLISRLMELFWPDLYPQPDERGVVTKLEPLEAFKYDDRTLTPFQLVLQVLPLSQGASPVTYLGWLEIQRGVCKPDDAASRIAQWESAARETSPEFFASLRVDLESCDTHLNTIGNLIEQHCGKKLRPSLSLRQLLQGCRERVREISNEPLPGEDTESSAPADEAGAANSGAAIGRDLPEIKSREDAINGILKISAYFRRIEPHSPISYQLERAARWARMSLEQLLDEVIPSEDAQKKFRDLTGLAGASKKSDN